MVLLDLDGTLVDTVPDLTYCLDTMLHKLSMPVAGEAKVREWVGNGIERLVKRALTNDLANNNFDREPEPSLFEEALPIFIDCYRQNACKQSRLYDGVRSLSLVPKPIPLMPCMNLFNSSFICIAAK